MNITELLNSRFGMQVKSLVALNSGADMDASVYKAETDKGSYFVKLKRGDQSFKLLEFLKESGIKEIIAPIQTVQIDGFTLSVYPFIEGTNGFHKKLTDEQWVAFGKVMRQIHDLKVPQGMVRREDYSSKWRDTVRGLKIPPYQETINRLVDRAEDFSKIVPSTDFVLCHSDIHAGNLLISENEFYIIDWDEPIMARKERDLMFIGGGVANVWNDPREEELFYKGYGKTYVDLVTLAYYRHERIVQDVAEYAGELCQPFLDMFAPNGVVDIAFRTDLGFIPLSEEHFPLMHTWFNRPHVQAFYSLREWALEDVRQKLSPYIQGQLNGYIICMNSKPIGYIQSYSAKEHPWDDQKLPEGAAGLDLFIGEEEYLGKGLGEWILSNFIDRYIWPYYSCCLVDPDMRNEASLRFFKKCGFKEYRLIDTQDALKRSVSLQLLIRDRTGCK